MGSIVRWLAVIAAILGDGGGPRAGGKAEHNIFTPLWPTTSATATSAVTARSTSRRPTSTAWPPTGCGSPSIYAGTPVCAPSRCTLLTGLHTGHALRPGQRELKPEGQACRRER